MKKSLQVIIILIIGLAQTVKAQKEAAAAAIGGAIVAGVVAAISIHEIKEDLELSATEYILENNPEITKFKVEISELVDNVKLSDLSRVSCLTFNVTILSENMKESERRILFLFSSSGWITEMGLNTTLIKFQLFNKAQWNNLLLTYLKAASREDVLLNNYDSIPSLASIPKQEYIENDPRFLKVTENEKSVKYFMYVPAILSYATINAKSLDFDPPYMTTLPFHKIDGDTYIKKKHSDNITIVYNEKTMGIYFSDLGKLVQLKRSALNYINKFMNPRI